ncbi:MAG: Fic family protein [Kiritimatiellia bacterium]
MSNVPPFTITPEILNAVARISGLVGKMDAVDWELPTRLRRQNRVKSITGTLAIEGNTLSEEQITAILDGKPVMGSAQELAEVKGAIRAYECLPDWNPTSLKDLVSAHSVMMGDVLAEAGVLRKSSVGIQKGDEILHIAPPADRVRGLMNELLLWVKTSEFHPLVTSSVFHYEFEFIHPFSDGNGRMGRLWQTRLLAEWHPLFYSLPLESVIRDHQKSYYHALAASDQQVNSTEFVSFMLQSIEEVLQKNAPLNASLNAPVQIEGLKTPDAVLACVRHDSRMTRKEMAKWIGKDLRTIGRAIRKLQDAGSLERVGSDKTGTWRILKDD